jgi:Fe-S-cluster containining protein
MNSNDGCENANPSILLPDEFTGSRLVHKVQENQKIAYKGKIGRRREQYCLEQIRYMGVCHKKIGQDQLEYVKARGEGIACGPGCSHCCRSVYVGATLQECEAIAYYLSHHEELLCSFLAAYPAWWDKVTRGRAVFRECEQLFVEMLREGIDTKKDKAFQSALKRHNRQGIVCPFLLNDLCSIYDVRPANCAGFFVTHSPELCRPKEGYEPKFNLTSIDDVLYDTSFYSGTLVHPMTLYLPVAVFSILESGFTFLGQLPGLAGMALEALNDPEVRAIQSG